VAGGVVKSLFVNKHQADVGAGKHLPLDGRDRVINGGKIDGIVLAACIVIKPIRQLLSILPLSRAPP